MDGLGNPIELLLSSGNDHDSKHAIELLSKTDITGSNILGDKAYGTKDILRHIIQREAAVVIPPKANCLNPWEYDSHVYKERYLAECFFQKIKWFRRISTRYDKLDVMFLSFVYLAAITVLLK